MVYIYLYKILEQIKLIYGGKNIIIVAVFSEKEHERIFWSMVIFIEILVTRVCTFVEMLNGTFMICACF